MDGDRKYKQNGYMDSNRENRGEHREFHANDRPKAKLPLDVTGPRLPRLVESVAAARCWNCAVILPAAMDLKNAAGECPKCHVPLHCCKMCKHFDSSTRFQCRKPITERIARKDEANSCTLFSPKVTIARDSASAPVAPPPAAVIPAPRNAQAARAAFDMLFKK
jgi:hypothetical protein